MTLSRRILHHGPHPDGTPLIIEDRAIRGCWFELHRQGGCGAGELRLLDSFPLRHDIEPGDWISCEGAPGDRWYLGRVETCRAESPAGLKLELEGMGVQLNEVFPGGFGSQADGANPHRYAATDLFANDPDHLNETVDFAESVEDVVRLLLQQYVTPATYINYVPSQIESPLNPADISSLKFRGEETVRTVIKDLAMRAQGASWGVNAQGEFYFLKPRDQLLRSYQESVDLISLEETRDREYLYNRLLLTGDYVYDRQEYSDNVARRAYRWRANFVQPESRARHGERRLRLWLPWIRTQADSRAFAREFFRTYANPQPRYLLETLPQSTLLRPWEGRVAVRDRSGQPLAIARIESIRVSFDRVPSFRIELGPEDPRQLWPEPPQDERWEAPEQVHSIGGPISSLPIYQNSAADSPSTATIPEPSDGISPSFASSNLSSDYSSDISSDWSSDLSSVWSWISDPEWSSFSDTGPAAPSSNWTATTSSTGPAPSGTFVGSTYEPPASSISHSDSGSSVETFWASTSSMVYSSSTQALSTTPPMSSGVPTSSSGSPLSSESVASSGTAPEPSFPFMSSDPPTSTELPASYEVFPESSIPPANSNAPSVSATSSFADVFSTGDGMGANSSGPPAPDCSFEPQFSTGDLFLSDPPPASVWMPWSSSGPQSSIVSSEWVSSSLGYY